MTSDLPIVKPPPQLSMETVGFSAMNGAALVTCRCRTDRSWRPRTIEVVVERSVRLIGGWVITVRARSRAEFSPLELLG